MENKNVQKKFKQGTSSRKGLFIWSLFRLTHCYSHTFILKSGKISYVVSGETSTKF